MKFNFQIDFCFRMNAAARSVYILACNASNSFGIVRRLDCIVSHMLNQNRTIIEIFPSQDFDASTEIQVHRQIL